MAIKDSILMSEGSDRTAPSEEIVAISKEL